MKFSLRNRNTTPNYTNDCFHRVCIMNTDNAIDAKTDKATSTTSNRRLQQRSPSSSGTPPSTLVLEERHRLASNVRCALFLQTRGLCGPFARCLSVLRATEVTLVLSCILDRHSLRSLPAASCRQFHPVLTAGERLARLLDHRWRLI